MLQQISTVELHMALVLAPVLVLVLELQSVVKLVRAVALDFC